MPPGLYTVTINSPSIPEGLTKTLTVSAANPNATIAETASTTTITVPGVNTTGISVDPSGDTYRFTINGTLVVSSIPAGASVYLDSVVVGNTPLTLNTVKTRVAHGGDQVFRIPACFDRYCRFRR